MLNTSIKTNACRPGASLGSRILSWHVCGPGCHPLHHKSFRNAIAALPERTWVWSTVPTWWLTIIHKASSREYDDLYWPTKALRKHGTDYMQTKYQCTQSNKITLKIPIQLIQNCLQFKTYCCIMMPIVHFAAGAADAPALWTLTASGCAAAISIVWWSFKPPLPILFPAEEHALSPLEGNGAFSGTAEENGPWRWAAKPAGSGGHGMFCFWNFWPRAHQSCRGDGVRPFWN